MAYGADDPPLRRWMAFVDGENFTIRAQALMESTGSTLVEGPFYSRDEFVWFPQEPARAFDRTSYDAPPPLRVPPLQELAMRAYDYTSVVGDSERIQAVKENLWSMGFRPEVFKKQKKNNKAKGVDVALTKDLLSNAFLDNYDVAMLYAGDGDYVPLIEEVKRFGKTVCVIFFRGHGLNDSLRLAPDVYLDATDKLVREWSLHVTQTELVKSMSNGAPPPLTP